MYRYFSIISLVLSVLVYLSYAHSLYQFGFQHHICFVPQLLIKRFVSVLIDSLVMMTALRK